MSLRSHQRQAGFTLLEVMVAFVVLAVALGLLLGMLSRGLRQVTQAQGETEAALYAQSLLDAVGTLDPIEPGVRDGEFDHGRYHWRMQVSQGLDPAPPPPPPEGAPPPVQAAPALGGPLLYRVALDVEWGAALATQKLHFDTLRLRAPPTDGVDAAAIAADAAANDADAAAGAVR